MTFPDQLKAALYAQHGQFFEQECLRCRDTDEGFAEYKVTAPTAEEVAETMMRHYLAKHPDAPELRDYLRDYTSVTEYFRNREDVSGDYLREKLWGESNG